MQGGQGDWCARLRSLTGSSEAAAVLGDPHAEKAAFCLSLPLRLAGFSAVPWCVAVSADGC